MTKFSKKIIIIQSVRGISSAIAVIFFFFLSILDGSEADGETIPVTVVLPYALIALFLVSIVIIVYSILYYKASGYSISNEEIKCQRGVIFKKISIIKREKINAINTRQSLLCRILGVKQVLVDSGSTNTAFRAEFAIYADNNEADLVYQQIKILKDTKLDLESNDSTIQPIEEAQDFTYSFTSKGKWFYAFANVVIGMIVLFFFAVIGIIALSIAMVMLDEGSWWIILIGIVLGWIGLSAFVSFISVLSTFFMYHDFKIKKGKTSLEISHGLFTKVNNSLEYSKIRGVLIQQNIIARIFGYATIYLQMVGYGTDTSGQSDAQNRKAQGIPGILIPLCKLEDANKYVEELLGKYSALKKDVQSPKVIPYLTWSSLFFTILFMIANVVILLIGLLNNQKAFYGFIGSGAFYILGEVLIILNGILGKKTNGIAIDSDKITVYTGSFAKRIYVIYKENLIGVEDRSTPLQRKARIYSYIIHYHNNSALNTIRVAHLDGKVLNSLTNISQINPEFVKNNISL